MNKFDKYYLKQGKLELSILDEDDEKVNNTHHEEDNKENREPRIKLTEDIYNTLQTMGKFLTKKVGDEASTSLTEAALDEDIDDKEDVPIAPKWNKIVKRESIKSIQAQQLEEAVKSVYAKAAEEAEEIDINATKPAESLIEETVASEEHQVEVKQSEVSIKRPVIFEDDENDNKELAQSSIDQILLEYFGDTKPQYEYAKRLKRHIDKKIALIENYQ